MPQNQMTAVNQGQSHTRINETLLGGTEKKVLLWLAARMPAWVVPDTLTMIGLLASVLIFISYALTYFNPAFLWLASLAFVLNWFGDSLDGTLARYRKIERPRYGFFVDHVIDSVSEALIFIGLGLSPYLRFDLALLACISYLMLSVYVYLVTYVNGVFRISYVRLGPTEVRLMAIATNTIVFFSGNPRVQVNLASLAAPFSLTFYDIVVIFVALLLVGIFIASTITTAMSLSREDRAISRARKLQERSARKARRQALRDERLMRKAAANEARKTRVRWQIPQTGQDQ